EEACLLAADVPALADFCAAQGWTLTDQAKRVRYLLLTDRFAEYQALDPDGALLQRAHRTATARDQTGMRRTLTAAGATDLVRQLIHGGWRAGAAASVVEHVAWVARSYADQRDWPALWELVP